MNKAISKGGPGVARRGLLLVLSSPSGAGKTTLARRLLAADAGIRMSVSVTTRGQRPKEKEGLHYHYWTRERFEERLAAGAFLVGLSSGLVFILVELLTDRALTRFLYNVLPFTRPGPKNLILSKGQVIHISAFELDQNVAVLLLLLWPAGVSRHRRN